MLLSRSLSRRYEVFFVFGVLVTIWQLGGFAVPPRPYGIKRPKQTHTHTGHTQNDGVDGSAANATLGFQTIISISSESGGIPQAWRREGLIKAANRTGLHIQIPTQRDVTFKELTALRDGQVDEDDYRPSEGQALAWLAHTDLLQSIIDTQTTTALILEDDADWDVSIRQIVPPIAHAIRTITNASASSQPSSLYPYGLDWDVLWLGHCGDFYDSSLPSNLALPDIHVLPKPLWRSVWLGEQYPELAEQTRAVHRSNGPICTFAYAVTLEGAKRVKEWASRSSEAFDVRMHQGCRNGGLRCLSVVPEVVHHQRMVGVGSLSTAAESEEDENGAVVDREESTFEIVPAAADPVSADAFPPFLVELDHIDAWPDHPQADVPPIQPQQAAMPPPSSPSFFWTPPRPEHPGLPHPPPAPFGQKLDDTRLTVQVPQSVSGSLPTTDRAAFALRLPPTPPPPPPSSPTAMDAPEAEVPSSSSAIQGSRTGNREGEEEGEGAVDMELDMGTELENENEIEIEEDKAVQMEKVQAILARLHPDEVRVNGHRVFTHNIMYSARCNWDRWGGASGQSALVRCLPSRAEWARFST